MKNINVGYPEIRYDCEIIGDLPISTLPNLTSIFFSIYLELVWFIITQLHFVKLRISIFYKLQT